MWGYVKEKVFVSSLCASLEELQAWITEVDVTTDGDMIHRFGMKLFTDGHLLYDMGKPH